MNLYNMSINKSYGEIGKQTSLVDINGDPLHVGDIVLLTDIETGVGRLRFVAHDEEHNADYVMGAYLQSVGYESKDLRKAAWKKIAGYQNFSNGFRLGDMGFVES